MVGLSISPGQPHVPIANACAMPHCSNVYPIPNGPPMNCACPHVTPNPGRLPPLPPNPNNKAFGFVNNPPARHKLHGNRCSSTTAGGVGVAGIGDGTVTTGTGDGVGVTTAVVVGCGVFVVGLLQPHGSDGSNANVCNVEHCCKSNCRNRPSRSAS